MEYILIGKIVNIHGIKGEVKIYPYTDDIDNLSNIIESTIETDEINQKNSIRQTILNDTIGLNTRTSGKLYFDKAFKVQLTKPDYFDPVILNDTTTRMHYVRNLAFEIAKDDEKSREEKEGEIQRNVMSLKNSMDQIIRYSEISEENQNEQGSSLQKGNSLQEARQGNG